MVQLIERVKDYVINVNNYPYLRTETIDQNKGIIRVYGKDGNKEKINYVIYPKKHYTKDYIEKEIIPQYETCPLCLVGRNINFKYKENKSKNIKFIPKIKENKMLNLKGFGKKLVSDRARPYVGQGLGAATRFGISSITTELGNKIINSVIGAVGNIVNEARFGNKLARDYFTHLMYAFADPTANSIPELKRNMKDLWAGLKHGDFGSSFGSLLEEPATIAAAWNLKGLGKLGAKFKGGGSSFKVGRSNYQIGTRSSVTEVEPKGLVSTYSVPITDKDLVAY